MCAQQAGGVVNFVVRFANWHPSLFLYNLFPCCMLEFSGRAKTKSSGSIDGKLALRLFQRCFVKYTNMCTPNGSLSVEHSVPNLFTHARRAAQKINQTEGIQQPKAKLPLPTRWSTTPLLRQSATLVDYAYGSNKCTTYMYIDRSFIKGSPSEPFKMRAWCT
jgi:hypothetical protein